MQLKIVQLTAAMELGHMIVQLLLIHFILNDLEVKEKELIMHMYYKKKKYKHNTQHFATNVMH